MPARKAIKQSSETIPMLKSAEQMSVLSGIGINRLRELMDKGELEYVQNGKNRLLADKAIWDWYDRNRVIPKNSNNGGTTTCQ